MNCPCCSGFDFEVCCKPFLTGEKSPETALQLMKSRYSAYAELAIDYLINTTHPSTIRYHNPVDILNWAKSSTWLKLEIISTQKGGPKENGGKVEFKAYFLEGRKMPKVHHEFSSFKKENNQWFFVDGKVKN